MEVIKVIKNKNKRVKEYRQAQKTAIKQNLEESSYISKLQEYIAIFDYLFMTGVKDIYITLDQENITNFINSARKLAELQKYNLTQISETKFKLSEMELELDI